MNRSLFTRQSRTQAADHQAVYRAMTPEQRAEAWQYLMRVAYGFVGKEWPKMDKTVFSRRSRNATG